MIELDHVIYVQYIKNNWKATFWHQTTKRETIVLKLKGTLNNKIHSDINTLYVTNHDNETIFMSFRDPIPPPPAPTPIIFNTEILTAFKYNYSYAG